MKDNTLSPHPVYLGSDVDPKGGLTIRFEYGPDHWIFKPENALSRLGEGLVALCHLDEERKRDEERTSKWLKELERKEQEEGGEKVQFQLSPEVFTEERIKATTSSITSLLLNLTEIIKEQRQKPHPSKRKAPGKRYERVIKTLINAVADGCEDQSTLVLLPIVLMVGKIPTVMDVLDRGVDHSQLDIPMKKRLRDIATEMNLPLGITINPKKRQKMLNTLRAEGYQTNSESVRKTLNSLGFYIERQRQE